MRRFFLVAALLASLFVVGCRAQDETIPTYTNPVETVEVIVDKEFVITIEYEPDDGYLWEEGYDESKLELIESICVICRAGEEEYLKRLGYGLYFNAPFTANYSRFKALKPGETEVIMTYKRPLVDEVVEQRIFKVDIK